VGAQGGEDRPNQAEEGDRACGARRVPRRQAAPAGPRAEARQASGREGVSARGGAAAAAGQALTQGTPIGKDLEGS
jgi:hypothetical protein